MKILKRIKVKIVTFRKINKSQIDHELKCKIIRHLGKNPRRISFRCNAKQKFLDLTPKV